MSHNAITALRRCYLAVLKKILLPSILASTMIGGAEIYASEGASSTDIKQKAKAKVQSSISNSSLIGSAEIYASERASSDDIKQKAKVNVQSSLSNSSLSNSSLSNSSLIGGAKIHASEGASSADIKQKAKVNVQSSLSNSSLSNWHGARDSLIKFVVEKKLAVKKTDGGEGRPEQAVNVFIDMVREGDSALKTEARKNFYKQNLDLFKELETARKQLAAARVLEAKKKGYFDLTGPYDAETAEEKEKVILDLKRYGFVEKAKELENIAQIQDFDSELLDKLVVDGKFLVNKDNLSAAKKLEKECSEGGLYYASLSDQIQQVENKDKVGRGLAVFRSSGAVQNGEVGVETVEVSTLHSARVVAISAIVNQFLILDTVLNQVSVSGDGEAVSQGERSQFWGQILGLKEKVQLVNASKVKHDFYGVVLGYDFKKADLGFGVNLYPSFFGALAYSKADLEGSIVKDDHFQAGIKLTLQKGNFYNAVVGYFGNTWSKIKHSGINYRADSLFGGAALRSSYYFLLGNEGWGIEPQITVAYLGSGGQKFTNLGNLFIDTERLNGFALVPGFKLLFEVPTIQIANIFQLPINWVGVNKGTDSENQRYEDDVKAKKVYFDYVLKITTNINSRTDFSFLGNLKVGSRIGGMVGVGINVRF